jgi:hypothetical protein
VPADRPLATMAASIPSHRIRPRMVLRELADPPWWRRRPAGRRDLGHSPAGVGTWPSTSGPSQSSTPSRRATSSPPSASRRERGVRIRVQCRRPQRGPDRLESGHAAAEDRAIWTRSRSTGGPPRTRRGGRACRGRSRSQPGPTVWPIWPERHRTFGVLGYALGGGLSWMIRTLAWPATASSRRTW